MGIYIPGIEMPKGHDCVTITIWPSGTASYGLLDREDNLCNYKAIKVYKAIKAVPVPPHGDLIERDALADSFEPSDFWNSDAEDNCFAAVRIVHSAPTIIPAEGKDE